MARSQSESDATINLTNPRQRHGPLIALCVAAYIIIAVAMFWPAPPWDTSRLPSTPINVFGPNQYGYGDPAQMTWFLAWVPYALRHGLSLFHTGFLDYPLGVSLANNTSAPLLGLIAAPVTVLLGPISAFNLLLRLALASSAASMFLVLRNWCRWPAAFIGGLAYGFGPYVVTQAQTHLNLAFVPLPPLIVWCLYELLFEQRRRPARMGVLLGVLAGAQVLISPELLALVVLVVALGLAGLVVTSRGDLQGRFGHLLKAAGPALIAFLVIDGWYFWCLLIAPGHLVGTVLPVLDLQIFRADLLGPFVPTLNQAMTLYHLWGWSERYVAGNLSENSTYMGVPMVLLLGYVAVRWRRDRRVIFSAVLAFVAFFLSLGSPLTINGHNTPIRLPEAVLAHVPVYDNIVPARFSFVVWLFAVIAVTIGGDRLVRSLMAHRPSGGFAAVARASGALLLLLAVALIVPRLPFKTEAAGFPPDTEATLNVIPPGSVVLTYPLANSLDTEAMSWQAQDEMRFRIIGGYATIQATQSYGLEYQPLLAPSTVQRYLVTSAYGKFDIFYPPPAANANPERALCQFIAKYHVNSVVFWRHDNYPTNVLTLFRHDLGAPRRVSRDKTLKVWLTRPGGCTP